VLIISPPLDLELLARLFGPFREPLCPFYDVDDLFFLNRVGSIGNPALLREEFSQPIDPRSFAALWPTLLWLAACLFLGDVAVRRIALDVDRIKQAAANEWRKLRGQDEATASDYMEKLRSRKAEVDEQLDRSRAATLPEVESTLFPTTTATGPVGEPLLDDAEQAGRSRPAERSAAPGLSTGPKEPEKQSYTNRLLKAKQRVWEEREKDNEKKP
ncbi:MAG: hypothetical protein ACLQGP_10710, partial [Isosphaeraceae bacterium]